MLVLEYFEEYRVDVAVRIRCVRGIDLRFTSSRKGNEWNKFIVCSTSKEKRKKGKKERKKEGRKEREKGHERNDQRDNRGGMNRRVQ